MDMGELDAAVAEIDAEIAAAESRLEVLRLEKLGAQALLQRLGRKSTAGEAYSRGDLAGAKAALAVVAEATNAAAASTHSAGFQGPTDLVSTILRERPAGMHLRDIEAVLADRGHPLNGEQVRGAVTYLKRKGRAETAARGVWRLVDNGSAAPTNAEATADTVASDIPAPTSERSGDRGADTSSSAQADVFDHSRMGPAIARP